jgi:hypothetical protein
MDTSSFDGCDQIGSDVRYPCVNAKKYISADASWPTTFSAVICINPIHSPTSSHQVHSSTVIEMSRPGDEFQDQADPGVEAPETQDTMQNDYKSRTGESHVPVIGDNAGAEDNIGSRESADRDAQLGTLPISPSPLLYGHSADFL